MSTAFVLAGGASLGAIEAGMAEALYERGIRADYMVGTSAGGLNAGFLATNPQEVASAHKLQDTWRGVTRRQVFPFSPATVVLGLLGRRNHLVSPRGLRRLIERQLDIERLEATDTPLGIVVTDLLCGQEKLVENGSAEDALAATAAIPGIYPPVEIDGRLCVDGGVADNTPISCAVERGCDEIYVLPTGMSTEIDEPPAGALAIGVHAATILLHERLRREVEEYRDRVRLVVLPPPWPLDVLPTDFSKADSLISRGLENARKALAEPEPEGQPTDEAMRRMTAETH
ncbi:MAG TPA: patatin-like phospholipase family protein [Thermoleophilaceae bacterium]